MFLMSGRHSASSDACSASCNPHGFARWQAVEPPGTALWRGGAAPCVVVVVVVLVVVVIVVPCSPIGSCNRSSRSSSINSSSSSGRGRSSRSGRGNCNCGTRRILFVFTTSAVEYLQPAVLPKCCVVLQSKLSGFSGFPGAHVIAWAEPSWELKTCARALSSHGRPLLCRCLHRPDCPCETLSDKFTRYLHSVSLDKTDCQ